MTGRFLPAMAAAVLLTTMPIHAVRLLTLEGTRSRTFLVGLPKPHPR